MDSDFTLNKMGWFDVELVEPNDFLNEKLENDMYGIWYTVKFAGDASTHLWQAKHAPTPGEKVYGHIEMTKSGKSTKFRRAKKDDTPSDLGAGGPARVELTNPSQTDDYWSAKDKAIRAQWAIGQAKDWALGNAIEFDEIEPIAKDFFGMVERVKDPLTTAKANMDTVLKKAPDQILAVGDGEFDFSHIPDFGNDQHES